MSEAPPTTATATPAPVDPLQEEWEGPLELLEGEVRPAVPAAELRDVDPPEREALEACLGAYGAGVAAALEARWTFKVLGRSDVEPHRRVVVVDRARVADLAPFPIVFIGLPILHLARKGARLTLEGGALVAPHAKQRVITLDEKGAQLFLYGRHLFARSILHVKGRTTTGDEVLVVDRSGRYLGIGVVAGPLGGRRRGEETVVVVKNRLDLGLYLRAQQAVPQ